jgi:hypothetical protein
VGQIGSSGPFSANPAKPHKALVTRVCGMCG